MLNWNYWKDYCNFCCYKNMNWIVHFNSIYIIVPESVIKHSTTDSLRKLILLWIKSGGELCVKDLENLKSWNLQVVTSLTSNLAPHGYEDLHNLAKRYKARFPELLNQSFTKDLFQVSNVDIHTSYIHIHAYINDLLCFLLFWRHRKS